METPAMKYVIWSYEHDAWWGPYGRGYVHDLEHAGRYDATLAGDIVINSILLEEIAMLEAIAEKEGAPKFHPYKGQFR